MKKITLILFLTLPLIAFSQIQRMPFAQHGSMLTFDDQTQTVLKYLQDAETAFKALDYEKAFFALENAVVTNPNSAEALITRARFFKMMGRTREANEDYLKADRINPYAADLYRYNGNNGLIRILSFEPEKAVANLSVNDKLNYYYQVIDNRILQKKITDNEIELVKDVIKNIETNELYKADSILNVSIKTYPESAIMQDLRGMILKENNIEEAKKYFNKAIKLDPQFAISWYNLGSLENQIGNYKSAKKYFTNAIRLQEDLTKAYFERALANKATGDLESALADYNKIIELKGSIYIEAFLNRGLTKKMMGDMNGAFMDLNQIINEFPNHPELRKNRGNLNLLLGFGANAIEDYTKAIELDDNYAEAYFNRALAYFQFFDKVSGCTDLEKSEVLGYNKAKDWQTYFCVD